MAVTAEAVPILSDNYAWLLREGTSGAVAIVDPADAKACIAALDKAGGKLDLILLTHHHSDHIAGADEVRALQLQDRRRRRRRAPAAEARHRAEGR